MRSFERKGTVPSQPTRTSSKLTITSPWKKEKVASNLIADKILKILWKSSIANALSLRFSFLNSHYNPTQPHLTMPTPTHHNNNNNNKNNCKSISMGQRNTRMYKLHTSLLNVMKYIRFISNMDKCLSKMKLLNQRLVLFNWTSLPYDSLLL